MTLLKEQIFEPLNDHAKVVCTFTTIDQHDGKKKTSNIRVGKLLNERLIKRFGYILKFTRIENNRVQLLVYDP